MISDYAHSKDIFVFNFTPNPEPGTERSDQNIFVCLCVFVVRVVSTVTEL